MNTKQTNNFAEILKKSPLIQYMWAIFIIILFWYILSLFFEDYIIPDPFSVIIYFFDLVQTAIFWEHAFASFRRVFSALFIAFMIAFPLGIYMGYKKRFDAFVSPIVFLTYPIPKIIFLPIFLMLFGMGDLSRILLIALTIGYQILIVTRESILKLDQKFIDSFKSLLPLPQNKNNADFSAKNYRENHYRTEKLVHLLIPAALPSAIMSLKVASATSVAVLFMVESFANRSGFGFYIMDAFGRNDTLIMFSGIIAMSMLGICLYEFCNLLERIFCPWQARQNKKKK